MVKEEHDFTARRTGGGVELVVRPGNKYGGAIEGEHILVDVAEAKNPSTLSACMSVQEAEDARVELEKKQLALKAKANKPNMITAVVEAELAKIASQGAAQDKAKAEALEAKEIAAEKSAREEADREAEAAELRQLKIQRAKPKTKIEIDKLKAQAVVDSKSKG